MRTVEVRSNIAGDIVKIRKGVVYKDYETVVDELLQNCQRAGATRIDVTVEGSLFCVTDNGVGCPDPQSLFEKNTSAWGNEDEAFGEGFFSVFLLADSLRVRSHDWELTLDVLKMLETKDMSIEVVDGLSHQSGMVVELRGTQVYDNDWRLRSETTKLAGLMDAVVFLNGYEETKYSVLAVGEHEFPVSHDLFEGVLRPTRIGAGVQYFYDNRPVREDWKQGVAGRIVIRKGCVTLKAPDRKEFIYDSKKEALDDAVREATCDMYRTFVQVASDDELDELAEQVTQYLDVDEYAGVLSVSEQLFQKVQKKRTLKDCGGGEYKPVPLTPELLEKIATLSDETRDALERERRTYGALERLIGETQKLVYVPAGEIEKYAEEIRKAEYAGFIVMYAPNKLYTAAFDYYGVPLLTSMDDLVEAAYLVENEGGQTLQELRLLELFERVEDHYELPRGSIRLADLRKETVHRATGLVVPSEDKVLLGFCRFSDTAVYIDRAALQLDEFAEPTDSLGPELSADDYRMLMRVMPALAHELAHLLYGTADNTLEHNNAQHRVSDQLARLF